MNKARVPRHPIIERAYPLIDCEVTRGGDGRTVTAYAATFANGYEVRDHMGHYYEELNRSSFNRAISRGIRGVQVLFNHGRTIDGTPSERFSMPLGTPIEVKPDARGLLTVTRYAKTPLGDEALELWDSGAIRGQSFRGPIIKTAPARRHESGLVLMERTEMGLREYGPCPFPVNVNAELVSVRSELLTLPIEELTDEERQQLLAALAETPAPTEDPALGGLSDVPGDEAEPPEDSGLSVDLVALRQAQRRRHLA